MLYSNWYLKLKQVINYYSRDIRVPLDQAYALCYSSNSLSNVVAGNRNFQNINNECE